MINLLVDQMPYTESGSLIYYFEQGHQQMALHCHNPSQRKEDWMYNSDERAFIKKMIKEITEVHTGKSTSVSKPVSAALIYLCIISVFVLGIALIVLSRDFLNNAFVAGNFLLCTTVLLGSATGLSLLAIIRYYTRTVTEVRLKEAAIKQIVDRCKGNEYNLAITLGELGLWLKVARTGLEFIEKAHDDDKGRHH